MLVALMVLFSRFFVSYPLCNANRIDSVMNFVGHEYLRPWQPKPLQVVADDEDDDTWGAESPNDEL